MSHVCLGLPGTSRVVPAKSQLPSLVPCPRCPMWSWDYMGYPEMSQLKVSYTALFQVPDVPCVPGITRDILECPRLTRTATDCPVMSSVLRYFLACPRMPSQVLHVTLPNTHCCHTCMNIDTKHRYKTGHQGFCYTILR